ncbi:MAG: cadherin-like domain-containing protein, partial [Anaerolineae bacterium]|nr:cadherin-like domain-containing protein [Anaerolineae bacterium]
TSTTPAVLPIANDDSASTELDTAVLVDVLANDTAGTYPLHPPSVVVVSQPPNGTVSVDPVTGEITYTPNPGFTGPTDNFTYTVADTQGNVSNEATVLISICSPPEAIDGALPDGYIADIIPGNGQTDVPLSTSTITIYFSQQMGVNVTSSGMYEVYQLGNSGKKVQIVPPVEYNPSTFTTTLTLRSDDPDWIGNMFYVVSVNNLMQNSCGTVQSGGASEVTTTFQTAP